MVFVTHQTIDDMLERNSVTVTLHDLDKTALGQLIDYAYTGEITISEDNVQVMIRAKSRFCVALFLDASF